MRMFAVKNMRIIILLKLNFRYDMSDIDKIKLLAQKGKNSVRNIMNFYESVDNILLKMQSHKLPIAKINIEMTVENLMEYFPKHEPSQIEYFLKRNGAKRRIEDGKEIYPITEILHAFNFMLQSLVSIK